MLTGDFRLCEFLVGRCFGVIDIASEISAFSLGTEQKEGSEGCCARVTVK